MEKLRHTPDLWRGVGRRSEAERARTAAAIDTASALRIIVENVLERPSELRYRRLSATSATFTRRVASCEGGLTVLRAAGFELQSMGPSLRFWVLPSTAVDEARLRQIRTEIDLGITAARRILGIAPEDGGVPSASASHSNGSAAPAPGVDGVLRGPPPSPSNFDEGLGPPPPAALPPTQEQGRLMLLQLRARSAVMRVSDKEAEAKRRQTRRRTRAQLGSVFARCAAALALGLAMHPEYWRGQAALGWAQARRRVGDSAW